MIKKILTIIFILLFTQVNAQNSLAKIEYSYAEEAFSKKEYAKAIKHLEEVKKILGSTNARVMYLELNALSNLLSLNKNTLEDYKLIKKLYNISTQYISNFENEVPLEKLKTIYQFKKTYTNYNIEIDNLIKGKKEINNEEFYNALKYYKIACDAKNAEACKNLANLYNLQKDFTSAKKFNDIAINLGSNNALYNKGLNYYKGINGYVKNINLATNLFEKAYNNGALSVSAVLADIYYDIGDKVKAKKLLMQSDNLGNIKASILLVIFFDVRDEVMINKAEKNINKMLKNNPNDGSALYYKSVMFFIKKKYPSAYYYFAKACINNHAFSCNYISEILQNKERSKTYGQVRNKKLAKYYKDRAYMLDPYHCN